MGKKARFRRVASTPITLKLDGVPTKIPPNGVFVSTVEMVGSLPGIRFEGFINTSEIEPCEPVKPTETQPRDPIKEWNDLVNNSTPNAEAEVIVDKLIEQEATAKVTPQVTPQVTPEVPTEKQSISVDVLLELKKKDNRAWMVMTKKELKSIMKEAGIDFSHIEDDRNQLYKFLSGIVKSL